MHGLELRAASAEEAQQIARLFFSQLALNQLRRKVRGRKRHDRASGKGNADALANVCRGNGRRMAAFLALDMTAQRVDQLFVAREVQRPGVGRALLDLAKQDFPTGF